MVEPLDDERHEHVMSALEKHYQWLTRPSTPPAEESSGAESDLPEDPLDDARHHDVRVERAVKRILRLVHGLISAAL